MKYNQEQREKLRQVAITGLGLLGAGSVVYYIRKNEKVRGHIMFDKAHSKSFLFTILKNGKKTIAQFAGEAVTDDSGEIVDAIPDAEGTMNPSDINRLSALVEADEKAHTNPLQTG